MIFCLCFLFYHRSSPCPTVKQGDDWKDPTCCEKGDSCQFCHTRTEQQFHPEIYKSTKCHDMTQSGYCPRGPFCAFAHVEQEIRIVEDTSSSPLPSVGSLNQITSDSTLSSVTEIIKQNSENPLDEFILPEPVVPYGNGLPWSSNFAGNINHDVLDVSQSLAQTSFGLDRNLNVPSSLSQQSGNLKNLASTMAYSKAPGSERTGANDQVVLNTSHTFISGSSNSAWPSLAPGTNLIGSFSSRSSSPNMLPRQINSLNSDAPPFYPADETVDSVVDSALKDHDDFKVCNSNGDKSLPSHIWLPAQSSNPDTNLSSSIFAMSDPVNIPQEQAMKNNIQPRLKSGMRLSSPVPGGMEFPSAGSLPSGRYFPMHQTPSSVVGSAGQLGLSSSFGSGVTMSDFEKMQNRCKQWEESWNQAKAACDAWKREATEANERAHLSEERCRQAIERYKMLESQFLNNNASGDSDNNCKFLHQQYEMEDLQKFSISNLKQLQSKYKADLEIVEKLLWEMLWKPQTN